MGLTIELEVLAENAVLILWAIAAVLVGRAVVIYVLGALLNRFSGTLPSRYHHVLFWGGLRGAISLALALALPFQVAPWRGRLLAMTFGVVLFTLLVQGTTIQWLLRRLGLTHRLPRRHEYEMTRARLYANQAAMQRLGNMARDGVLSASVWDELRTAYQGDGDALSNEIHSLYEAHEELRRDELFTARRDALRSERSALQDLLRRGMLSEEAYRELVGEIDQRRQALEEM